MKPRGIVFVSCGQRTVEEKALGSKICELINATENLNGYFAQDESTLEGLTGNIFMRLDKCVALITVMHRRGRVAVPGMPAFDRASVFVEQEIGIAAFLKQSRSGPSKCGPMWKKASPSRGCVNTFNSTPCSLRRRTRSSPISGASFRSGLISRRSPLARLTFRWS